MILSESILSSRFSFLNCQQDNILDENVVVLECIKTKACQRAKDAGSRDTDKNN